MAINRVTFSSNMLLIRSNLYTVQRQYEEASIPATTGRKINNLSDDATVLTRLFTLRSKTQVNEQYQKNINDVSSKLKSAESQLTSASEILEQLREVALQANEPTLSPSLKSQLNDHISLLKSQFLGFANAREDGKYIFAGTKITTLPFQDSGGGVITFNGNSDLPSTQLNESIQVESAIDGNLTFSGSIATAGATSLLTSLKNGDSVGMNLAAGDVINIGGDIGGAFAATYTVTSTSTLQDLRAAVQTALQANGDGTETATIRPDGAIRVTSSLLSPINNLTLSVTGKTIFNDAFTYPAAIPLGASTGDSDAIKTGTGEDIFDVFDDLQAAILTGSQSEIGIHLGRVDNSIDQILDARALVGIRYKQVDAIETENGDISLKALEDLANVEDASLDEVLTNLVLRETALRTVFATSTRILNSTSNLQLGA